MSNFFFSSFDLTCVPVVPRGVVCGAPRPCFSFPGPEWRVKLKWRNDLRNEPFSAVGGRTHFASGGGSVGSGGCKRRQGGGRYALQTCGRDGPRLVPRRGGLSASGGAIVSPESANGKHLAVTHLRALKAAIGSAKPGPFTRDAAPIPEFAASPSSVLVPRGEASAPPFPAAHVSHPRCPGQQCRTPCVFAPINPADATQPPQLNLLPFSPRPPFADARRTSSVTKRR